MLHKSKSSWVPASDKPKIIARRTVLLHLIDFNQETMEIIQHCRKKDLDVNDLPVLLDLIESRLDESNSWAMRAHLGEASFPLKRSLSESSRFDKTSLVNLNLVRKVEGDE